MPATILSDNGASSGTAGLKTSGSNDGILELQTTTGGGTATAAITIDTAQRSKFPTTIGVGGATPSTSGSGITFPASASPSSNANTLDDYEEGTWTPIDQSGAGLTLTNAQGKYTKIGRQVTAWGWVEYPSTANGTNNQLGGLPFTIANSNPDRGGGMIGFKTDSTVVTLRPENSGTLFQFKDSTGGNITNATLSTDAFFFAMTYQEA
jgi:hypothetical protein